MKTAPLVVAMKHELEVPSGWGKGTAGRGDSPCESVRTPQFRAQTAGCWWERGGGRRWRPEKWVLTKSHTVFHCLVAFV